MRTTFRLAAVLLLLTGCDKKKPTEPTNRTGSLEVIPTAGATGNNAALPG